MAWCLFRAKPLSQTIITQSFDARQCHQTPHCSDARMSAMVSQITGVSIVCLTVCSDTDQRKHQSTAPLAFRRGNHWRPVDLPHKGPVKRWKCFYLMTSPCNIEFPGHVYATRLRKVERMSDLSMETWYMCSAAAMAYHSVRCWCST